MQCSQSLPRPFKGWPTDFVQIPANFIWGSRGMAQWFLSHAQARLEGMVEWDEKNKLHLFQHSILCVSHLKGLHNVLAPNWRGSFLFPSWKSRRIKRSEAWSPTWGPLMQCSQSLSRPFKGWPTNFVQIPANFIWGSRGIAGVRQKKQAAHLLQHSILRVSHLKGLNKVRREALHETPPSWANPITSGPQGVGKTLSPPGNACCTISGGPQNAP